jgi:hypothetical protein
MNYSYQATGLRVRAELGYFEYSQFPFDPLDETDIHELVGVQAPSHLNSYQFLYYTGGDRKWARLNQAVDWNRNGVFEETSVQANINNDVPDASPILTSRDDWQTLVYTGILRQRNQAKSLAKISSRLDALSFESCATTEQLGNVPPPSPEILGVQRNGTTVTFSWAHLWKGGGQTEPTFSHYNVYRSINSGPLELIGTTTDNIFVDTLDPSFQAAYAVSVVAVTGGEGEVSTPQEVVEAPSLITNWHLYN